MASSGNTWKPLGEHVPPAVAPTPAKRVSFLGRLLGFKSTPDPTKEIKQEFVVCVPPFPKRYELTQKLVSNKNLILVDLDSFIKTINEKELLSQIEQAEKDENNGLHHVLYSMAASKALDFVRREVSKDKNMRAVFITSDYEWSTRNFDPQCLYATIPSRDLHKQILEATPADEKEKVDKQRTDFITRLPYDAVRTFHTFDELEQMIRNLFDIQHKH